MSPVVSAPQGFTTRRGLSVSDWEVWVVSGFWGFSLLPHPVMVRMVIRLSPAMLYSFFIGFYLSV